MGRKVQLSILKQFVLTHHCSSTHSPAGRPPAAVATLHGPDAAAASGARGSVPRPVAVAVLQRGDKVRSPAQSETSSTLLCRHANQQQPRQQFQALGQFQHALTRTLLLPAQQAAAHMRPAALSQQTLLSAALWLTNLAKGMQHGCVIAIGGAVVPLQVLQPCTRRGAC